MLVLPLIYQKLHTEVHTLCTTNRLLSNAKNIRKNLEPINGILNEAIQQLDIDFKSLSDDQIQAIKRDIKKITCLIKNENKQTTKRKKTVENLEDSDLKTSRLAELNKIAVNLRRVRKNAVSLRKVIEIRETLRWQQLQSFDQFLNSIDERIGILELDGEQTSDNIRKIVILGSELISDMKVLNIIQDVNTQLAALSQSLEIFRNYTLQAQSSFTPLTLQITESQYTSAVEEIDCILTKIGRIRYSANFFLDDSKSELQHHFSVIATGISKGLPNEQPFRDILQNIQTIRFLYNYSMNILEQSSLNDIQKGSLIVAYDEIVQLLVKSCEYELPEFNDIIQLEKCLKQPLSFEDRQEIEKKIESIPGQTLAREINKEIKESLEMVTNLGDHLKSRQLLDNEGLPSVNLIFTFDNPLFNGPISISAELLSEIAKAYQVYYEHLSQIKQGTFEATRALVNFDELLKKCVIVNHSK